MEEGKYYGKTVISNYGVDETLTIVIEECLELGKCITKYKREKNSKNLEYHRDRIIEEIADLHRNVNNVIWYQRRGVEN